MKKLLFILFIAILATSCLTEEDPFLRFRGIEPAPLDDGWALSTPSDQNMDEQQLTAIYRDIVAEGEPWQLRSLLVFRNNSLVAEAYLKDEDDKYFPRPIWSCTKQIVGILTGIAIQNGIINSVDDPISLYLSSELADHPDKSDITVSDLLTMRAGIGFDETKDVSALLQRKPANTIDFILGRPLIYTPGQTFNYNSGETHLITASIQNFVNRPLKDWADEVLFSKIEFRNYTWLEYDGYNFGGYGISTTPRELAKIAQLTLNKGNWKGDQVIDTTWVEEMTTPRINTIDGGQFSFGYLWWINESENIYYMAGSGGQYACIVPDEKIIVVVTSEYDTDGDLEVDFESFLDIVKKIRNTAY